MPKKFYTPIPTNYPVCEHSDCPMAVTCLHQIVYATMLENKGYIHLINPTDAARTKHAVTIATTSLPHTHEDSPTSRSKCSRNNT